VTDTATGATERPEHATSAPPPADLTLVVPTLNERDNVAVLVERLGAVLDGVAREVVLVDDDPTDGTVMDADLQYDEALLPDMLAALRTEGLDIVIGSRFTDGGARQNALDTGGSEAAPADPLQAAHIRLSPRQRSHQVGGAGALHPVCRDRRPRVFRPPRGARHDAQSSRLQVRSRARHRHARGDDR
jgi:glycosyltransferase involved in cell wall biosynthesis